MRGTYIIFAVLLFVLYVALAVACARKRRWVFFVIGFFLPILWLIGAILPAKR
jgi:hypothetical protein